MLAVKWLKISIKTQKKLVIKNEEFFEYDLKFPSYKEGLSYIKENLSNSFIILLK